MVHRKHPHKPRTCTQVLVKVFQKTIHNICLDFCLLGSNNCGSVTVSKDLILICQCHQDSIRNQSCEKYKIPSTILSKLVAHSSTENFIVVVVDRIDISKPEDEKLKLHCWKCLSTSTLSSWQGGPSTFHGPMQREEEKGMQLQAPVFW